MDEHNHFLWQVAPERLSSFAIKVDTIMKYPSKKLKVMQHIN
jgi:hypothetical protein